MRWAGMRTRAISVIAALGFVCCVAVGVTVIGGARLLEPSGQRDSVLGAARAELIAGVTFAPSPDATAVAPNAPIVVTSGMGRLVAVRATSTTGAVVGGSLARSAHVWRSTGFLEYGSVYNVSALVTGAANVSALSTMSFRTLRPTSTVTATVFPGEGLAVGVGQPIVFTFSQPIDTAARAGPYRHLSVRGSRKIVGGWHWFNDHELHFRPRTFWPAGERVTVAWNLNGWNVGGGTWGMGGATAHFTVGDTHVSFANLSTDQMTVTVNGLAIATFPISGGRPSYPTMDGVHVVLDRASVVHMVSSTNGIPVDSPDGYDELVYDDVRISDSGEYVHAAPWSVSSQGNANVSHGCINLSPEDAAAFFAFSRVGDVVVVTGSPRPPEFGDHGVMDWDTSWSGFTRAR